MQVCKLKGLKGANGKCESFSFFLLLLFKVRISLKLFFFFFFIFFNHFSFYLEEMGGARSGRCVTQTPNYLTQPESDLEREPRRGHLFFLVILSCYLVVKTSLLTRAATAFVSAVTTPVVQRAQKELA